MGREDPELCPVPSWDRVGMKRSEEPELQMKKEMINAFVRLPFRAMVVY
jgi:hypothetical protein